MELTTGSAVSAGTETSGKGLTMFLLGWLERLFGGRGKSSPTGAGSAQPSRPQSRRGPSVATESLETRVLLASDFGDAPDTGAGTGAGNYETLNANGGPSHTVDGNIYLGPNIDSEADATANAAADGDDTTLLNDENGVVDPQADFLLTAGTQPTITLRATNNTGSAATLYGWIDYNGNGVFNNTTERASVMIPDGTNDGIFTLTFPVVPTGFTGKTYARFRLSTDIAAANPTGAASDGEVEDYAVTITDPSDGTVKTGGATKLADGGTNMPTLADADGFGESVANLGDLDGDGVADLAVGAEGDDTGGSYRGAVHILFLNADGTVKSSTKIASGTNGGPSLANYDRLGTSVANLGDVDGDGVADLAVGARGDDTGGTDRGAVHILFLNANGTVKSSTKIASGTNGGPSLADLDQFGSSVANLGDLDGDGAADLAVGARADDTGGYNRGAVHILFLYANGTVKSSTKIASGTNGGPSLADGDFFGWSEANLGDLDGDGVADLAVGAYGDDTGGSERGAVHILFLNADGTVKSSRKIASGMNGAPTLTNFDWFGTSVANLGDLDGDGAADLAVGVLGDNTGGSNRGAVHLLFLNANGTVQSTRKIASGNNGGPTLADNDWFGTSVTNLGDLDGDGATDLAVGAYGDDTGGPDRGAVHILRLSTAAAPRDFGDAPDTGAGTGTGNYETLNANGGPSHTIVSGLQLGTRISGEADATANIRANGDDIGTDDEDGVVNPQADFLLTAGTQPTITLRATNHTGSAATLYGWIDTNGNGVFDNATERASVTIPNGTTNGTFTMTFPVVPTGFTGKTYARFRLSTDAAAANSTGAATDGEVEDYAVTITGPSDGTVKTGGATKLANGGTNMPTLANQNSFGGSVANLGDLDGDGVADLAVGAYADSTGGTYRGAVHILFLNADGTVKSSTKIASGTNGGPTLADNDWFGWSVANLGDLDGDGVADLAAGAANDNTGGSYRGAVHILFLNADGTVKSSTKIASGTNGGPTLADSENFGSSVASLGDLDGDGVADLAVGARGDDTGGSDRGEVHILFLNADGTVKSSAKIANGTNGGPTLADSESFGSSVANLGDLDGDDVADLAVGARGDDTGGPDRGAVHILFLNANGTVKSSAKIASGTTGSPTLSDLGSFGSSVANLGDLDGDGVPDLAVGTDGDDTGGPHRGAVHILFLNANGTVKSSAKIASGTNGGPILADINFFGRSVANLGDLDGDGRTDLAAGAPGDNTGGSFRGAIHILRLNTANQAPTAVALQNATTSLAENTSTASAIKLADIAITDDAHGTNTLSLAGTDAAFFEIVGTELRLKAGTVLNFEAKSSYSVTVRVDDTGVGSTPDASVNFTLTITNVNEAPTVVALQNATTSLAENTSTASAIKLADIVVTDDALGTNTLSLAGTDAAFFEIVGTELRLKAGTVLNFEAKSSYSISVRVDDTGVGSTPDATTTFTLTITNVNEAPVLDNSGSPFVVLGVGARQSLAMRQGILVSELLARGAGGNPISDQDAGAVTGIALTAIDQTYGTFQYTLVSANPAESDWIDVETAGAISSASALLLSTTSRLWFKTALVPHHEAGPQFLALESKLDTGLTFRAWDQVTGTVGGRADTTTNGGSTAFSTAVETSRVYFETRLWRHYNRVAGINVDTLQAEFDEVQRLANLYNPDAFEDRANDAFTGFSVLMSAVPELLTTPLYRLYFGVQFNVDGSATDMGYRYLTTNLLEVEELELNGPVDKRAERAGTYFREVGINNGTGIIGYVFTTQQPGTSAITQIYRSDLVNKPTRSAGTPEGGTPTLFRLQESGDHVYTTNVLFESSRTGTWRIEAGRGFARELSPNTGGAQAISAEATGGIAAPPAPAPAATTTVAVQVESGGLVNLIPAAINWPTLAAASPDVGPNVTVSLIAIDEPAAPRVDTSATALAATTEDPSDDDSSDDRGSPPAASPSRTVATDSLFAMLTSRIADLCPW